jgi:hypothetical protein
MPRNRAGDQEDPMSDDATPRNSMRMLRWLAPAVLAIGIGVGATVVPAPAQAQDDLTRVLVDIADVVIRSGTPYYRHGDYGYDDRLSMQRDGYGHPVYYRSVPRYHQASYRPAYGYRDRDVKCNKHGKCKASYYDARRDDRYRRHDRDDDRYYGRYEQPNRDWDGRRGRGRDDDDD